MGYSQQGISGTLIDGDFNEPLPFANILVKETGDGITSDFDGKYAFELSAGTYTLVFSFVGYETKEITSIIVISDNYTTTDVVLNSVAQGLDEVIVSIEARRNTETSVLEIQYLKFKENQQAYWMEFLLKPLEKLAQAILHQQLKVSLEFLYKMENMCM